MDVCIFITVQVHVRVCIFVNDDYYVRVCTSVHYHMDAVAKGKGKNYHRIQKATARYLNKPQSEPFSLFILMRGYTTVRSHFIKMNVALIL